MSDLLREVTLYDPQGAATTHYEVIKTGNVCCADTLKRNPPIRAFRARAPIAPPPMPVGPYRQISDDQLEQQLERERQQDLNRAAMAAKKASEEWRERQR